MSALQRGFWIAAFIAVVAVGVAPLEGRQGCTNCSPALLGHGWKIDQHGSQVNVCVLEPEKFAFELDALKDGFSYWQRWLRANTPCRSQAIECATSWGSCSPHRYACA